MTRPTAPHHGGRLVRPYAMTGGRTGSEFPHVALEALVAATPIGTRMSQDLRWEAAEIVDLAGQGTAIVELAARLELPIGVVRVLAGDLSEAGAVAISNPASDVVARGGEDYTQLLERVVDGIKAL